MASEIEERYLAAWTEFRAAVDGIEDDEAAAFSLPVWPSHEYFAGEDGSISGIVRHVAAWKDAYAEGLESGSWGDENAPAPRDDGSWRARLQWLDDAHARLLAILRRLEADDNANLLIDDRPYTLEDVVGRDMSRHDEYHSAQVNYLRQRYLAERS